MFEYFVWLSPSFLDERHMTIWFWKCCTCKKIHCLLYHTRFARMQMNTGLALSPVVHVHCHFCVGWHDICLVTHCLHSPWWQHLQGHAGNLQCVLCHMGSSRVSPFCVICQPCSVICSVIWSFLICFAKWDDIIPSSNVLHMVQDVNNNLLEG